MFNSKKLIKSANFKMDYIAFFAIFLFVVIVVAELSVIVGIPIIINHTQIYADFEVRNDFINTFDDTRKSARTLAGIGDANLILWDLNQMATFLREKKNTIPMEVVDELFDNVRTYQEKLNKLANRGKSYLQYKEIDFDLLKKNIENTEEK